ncbi:transcriptional regulator [Herbaspirillum seropedicae]|nr:Mor transcription activator family protein [Herbaspirillum seropedicae]UMU19866.1 transcriptional regulator [Herbaspirillum seropedicae]
MKDAMQLEFPPEYPELLEQMGQIIGRKLVEHGLGREQAQSAAFEIAESIRTEIGGVQQYIPRGLRFQLSRRDQEIFEKFNGQNYHQLAHSYHLSEMQVRNIVKRGLARERAARQASLL